jgi:hypothetical protein
LYRIPPRVNVRCRPEVGLPGGLFGRHVGGGAEHLAGDRQAFLVGRWGFRQPCLLHRVRGRGRDSLGQPPVNHQGLAVVAEHDVVGLEVAVDDPLAVGVGHRLAGGDEALKQFAEGDRRGLLVVGGDGPGQGPALDVAHGVVRQAVAVGLQRVDRHDAGVLELAGDGRLGQEAAANRRAEAVGADFLEGDGAAELLVASQADPAEAALGQGGEDGEAAARAAGHRPGAGRGGKVIDGGLRRLREGLGPGRGLVERGIRLLGHGRFSPACEWGAGILRGIPPVVWADVQPPHFRTVAVA